MKIKTVIRELAEEMINFLRLDDDPKEGLIVVSIAALVITYAVVAGVYLLIAMVKANVILWLLNIVIGFTATATFTAALVIYIAIAAILLNEMKSDEID